MTLRLTTELRDDEAKALLDRVRREAEDATPMFREIGASLVENIRLGFAEGRSPWGEKWAKPKGRDGQPLIDTGLLRNSFSYRATKTGVAVGTNRRFSPKATAAVHQFGTRDGRLPARPFMPIRGDAVDLPPSWEREVVGAIRRHAERMTGE